MANTETTKTETGTCVRCGRTLTSSASIRRGYGKGCAAKIRHAAADLADFKTHQLDSARELIEDGAIIPLRNQVFVAVSSDGTETYYSHPTNCNCPGANRGRRCYHMLAARLLLAA